MISDALGRIRIAEVMIHQAAEAVWLLSLNVKFCSSLQMSREGKEEENNGRTIRFINLTSCAARKLVLAKLMMVEVNVAGVRKNWQLYTEICLPTLFKLRVELRGEKGVHYFLFLHILCFTPSKSASLFACLPYYLSNVGCRSDWSLKSMWSSERDHICIHCYYIELRMRFRASNSPLGDSLTLSESIKPSGTRY